MPPNRRDPSSLKRPARRFVRGWPSKSAGRGTAAGPVEAGIDGNIHVGRLFVALGVVKVDRELIVLAGRVVGRGKHGVVYVGAGKPRFRHQIAIAPQQRGHQSAAVGAGKTDLELAVRRIHRAAGGDAQRGLGVVGVDGGGIEVAADAQRQRGAIGELRVVAGEQARDTSHLASLAGRCPSGRR